MPIIQRKASNIFTEKFGVDNIDNSENCSNNLNDPSTTKSNHPIARTNKNYHINKDSPMANSNRNKYLNNNSNNNNNLESDEKVVKRNKCTLAGIEYSPTINEQLINNFNNSKFIIRTKSIKSENYRINNNINFNTNINNIEDNNDEENNHNDNNKLTKGKNKKKSIKNSKEINKTETLSGKYKSENAQHSSKRKVKSKLIRSYTFNFAQKPDLACEAPKNSNIGPNNIYNKHRSQ